MPKTSTTSSNKDIKSLITTPIYYVNDVPHIGHTYSTIIADMLKKYKWLRGEDVFLLTGTDEHGQKIELSAKAKGKTPKQYADEISSKFRDLWDRLGIEYDYFIRTTDEGHKEAVANVFEEMCKNGDVYLGEYEGDYCVSCESYYTGVENGKCPECPGDKPLTKIKEESYFFALSRYEKRLLEWYKNGAILPIHKRNEVIAFVENGLKDLSISRTSFEWGIKLPKVSIDGKTPQKEHIVYVWLDALFNYLSALGFYQKEKSSHNDSSPKSTDKKRYWENATHIVGKDILRFHAVYWPAFLMSLGMPLPKHIYAHGWWLRDGQKMSKSLGNVINPSEFASAYGIENLRFYLLREAPFGQDGDFSQKALVERINTELSNDLGNLLNRLIGISEKYTNLEIHLGGDDFSSNLAQGFGGRYKGEWEEANAIFESAEAKMEAVNIKGYIEDIWRVLHLANASVAKYEPWNLYKNGEIEALNGLLALLANLLLKVGFMLFPVMPKTTQTIARAFGVEITQEDFRRLVVENVPFRDLRVQKTPPLFSKIDGLLIDENYALESKESKQESKNAHEKNKNAKNDSAKNANAKIASAKIDGVATIQEIAKDSSQIGIEDFSKVDIRVGEILSCEALPKSNKLLRLSIDMGEESPRVVLSGIAQFYRPDEIIGRQVCVVANLKPAKIMGEFSYGMILASKDENGLSLLGIDGKRKNGSKVS